MARARKKQVSGGSTRAESAWEPIGDLRPDPKNHRHHPESQVERIAASLKEYGWGRPILARLDGMIIAGHGTWLAAKKIGMEKALVRRLDLDAQRARELGVLDNQLPDFAEDSAVLIEEVLASGDVDFRGLLAETLSTAAKGSIGAEGGLTTEIDIDGEDPIFDGRFELVVRGSLADQESVIQKLTEALRGAEDVTVEATWT